MVRLPARLFSATAKAKATPVPPAHVPRSIWPKLLTAAGLGSAVAGGALYYTTVLGPKLHAPPTEVVPVLELQEPTTFVHPYNDYNILWKAYFATKRFLYLCFLFVPCISVFGIVQLTNSPEWREYGLELLVSTLEAAGCSFQKFGQWLSMRPDMFPPDLINALSRLRDQVPSHDFQHTRKMIKESFGMEIEEIFEEFDERAVASGTVAQVHRAVLKPQFALENGQRTVAVKVRHPHVLDEIWLDTDVIFTVLNNSQIVSIPFSKPEFVHMIQKQVDFKWEAHNLALFNINFQSEIASGKVFFPTVKRELLSQCILVESWAPGQSISAILSRVGENFRSLADGASDALHSFSGGISRKKKELAQTVFDLNMKMFLRDNLVHGDLHGGNVLYNPENSCCTVLDAGMTTCVDDATRKDFGRFLHALCMGDESKMTSLLMTFQDPNSALSAVRAVRNKSGHVERLEVPEATADRMRAFRKDFDGVIAKHMAPGHGFTRPDGGMIDLGDTVAQIMYCLQRHDLQLRADVASSIMTMSVSEGLIRALDPDFDIVKRSIPYFCRYM